MHLGIRRTCNMLQLFGRLDLFAILVDADGDCRNGGDGQHDFRRLGFNLMLARRQAARLTMAKAKENKVVSRLQAYDAIILAAAAPIMVLAILVTSTTEPAPTLGGAICCDTSPHGR